MRWRLSFLGLAMTACVSGFPTHGVTEPTGAPPELRGGRIYIPYSRTHYKSSTRRAGFISMFSNDVQDETETKVTKVEALGAIVLELTTERCDFAKNLPPSSPPEARSTIVVGGREFGWRQGGVVELRGGEHEIVYPAPLFTRARDQRWLSSASWPVGELRRDARLVLLDDGPGVLHQDGALHQLVAGGAQVALFGERYAATASEVYDLQSRNHVRFAGVTKIGVDGERRQLILRSAQQEWRGDDDLRAGDAAPPDAVPLGAFGHSIYFHAPELSTIMRFDARALTWHEVPYLRCAPTS